MSGCLSGLVFDNVGTLQSCQVKRTPIGFIKELINGNMNLSVVAAASLNSNLSSGMHNEQ